jgi:nitrite reductase/ring-hydroxylating ferredoxin subunit
MGAESWSNDIALACTWHDTGYFMTTGALVDGDGADAAISANGGDGAGLVWESDDDSDYGLMQFATETLGNAAAISMSD